VARLDRRPQHADLAKRKWKWSSFCSGAPSSMKVKRNHVSSPGHCKIAAAHDQESWLVRHVWLARLAVAA
jgi:hypothetical protein